MSKKTVFISYSHDSDKQQKRVLALSERLRTDGLETILDQYLNGSPLQGWPRCKAGHAGCWTRWMKPISSW